MGTVPWGRPAWKIDPKPGSGGMVAEWLRNGCGTYGEPFCGPWHIFTSKLIYSDISKLRNEKQKRKRTTISKVTHLVCLSCYRFYSWKVYELGELSWSWWFGRLRTEWLLPKENHQSTCKTTETSWKRELPKENDLSEYSRNTYGMVILIFTFLV